MQADHFLASTYEKIRLLKKSARSEVWLVTDKQGTLAILKRSQSHRLPLQELKTAAIPLLPKIHYIINHDEETITIEEYIHGQSLADRLQTKKYLTEKEACQLLLTIGHGLARLHALGIIHRDIKPEHIIVEKDNTPRLIDFDACRRFKDGQTEDTALLGTKTYAPPEQFGFQQTDPRSDIYALGKTIQELLSPDYNGRLLPILQRCQRLDPADRYQNMHELKKAIKRPALNKKIAPLLLLPVLALLAYHYPVLQQAESPAPTTTEESSSRKPADTETPQEEKNAPPAAETITPPSPTTTPNTSVTVTTPPTSPSDPAISTSPAPTAITTNYIRVQYFWNGRSMNDWMENFNTDIDNSGTTIKIPRQYWIQQDNPQGIIHLSPNDSLKIRIHNKSAHTWNNAHAVLHYSSNGQTDTQHLPVNSLAPDETTDINIPLTQYPIVNPQRITNQTIGELKIEVKSDSPQEIRCSRYFFSFLCLP